MRTAVFVSIREKATRLAGKSLRLIHGQTLCERMIRRVQLARRPDLVVLTTSVDPRDLALCQVADACGVPWFRGSEDDKLDRYLQAARAFGLDFVVIADGDDPLVSEEHIDRVIEAFAASGADYITTRGLPLGVATHGLRVEALAEACRIKAEADTEVWGGYFTAPGRFKAQVLEPGCELYQRPDIRLSIDYQEDLDLFEAIYAALAQDGPTPPFRAVMAYLAQHPEVVAINQGVQARYEMNLRKSAPVRFKEGV